MGIIFRSIMPAIAAIALSACQGGSDHMSGSGPGSSTPQRGMLLQSPPVLTATFSPSALLSALSSSAVGQTFLRLSYSPACSISVYHLEYETVDAAGNLTPASGALMVPSGSAGCEGGRPILLYGHGTATDRQYDIASLTASDNGEGLVLAAVFAAQGYIVVAPNYVGYDTSTLAYHPFLDADQQSKDMMDALTAARSALPVAGASATSDGGKLLVSGYSQGGYVAMATQRALESSGINVTAGVFMSGPYALSAFADAVFEGRVNASAVPNFTMLLSSYEHAYGNVYSNASDVAASPYAASLEALLPSKTPLGTLESDGDLPPALFDISPPSAEFASDTPASSPAALAVVFAAGFGNNFLVLNSYRLSYLEDAKAAPDGGFPVIGDGLPPASPMNAFRQDLKENDLRAFAPKAPVLLCGGHDDPTVFFLNTQLMQNYWTAHAPPGGFAVLDVDATPTSADPYANYELGFTAAEALVRAAAIAAGATDGGSAAVLEKYHAGLVAPFCMAAAKAYFDAH
jgi:hypothetical protein